MFLFLVGCSEKTTSVSQINTLKSRANQQILSQYPHTISHKNKFYQKKINSINKHLSDVNKYLYGNSYEVRARFVQSKNPFELAFVLPDDTFMVTDVLMDVMGDTFTDDEVVALVCHESAHILNGDWGERYRENTSYVNYSVSYSVDVPNPLELAAGYALTNLTHSKKMKPSEYLKEASKQKALSSDSEKTTFTKGTVDVNTLTIQGFPLSDELNADKIAVKCLYSLGVDTNSLTTFLQKLVDSGGYKNDQLLTRIKKLKE